MLLCHSSNAHQSRRGRMKRHSDMSPFSDSGPKPSSSMLMAFKPTGCSQPNRTEQSSVVRLKDSKDEGGGWRPNRHWIALFIGTQREREEKTSPATRRKEQLLSDRTCLTTLTREQHERHRRCGCSSIDRDSSRTLTNRFIGVASFPSRLGLSWVHCRPSN